MKNIKILAVIVAGGIIAVSLAVAQVDNGSGTGQGDARHHGDHLDTAAIVEHLSKAFPKIAAFDVNKDGKLDAKERESMMRAIADGKLQVPDHSPQQLKDGGAKMVAHISEVFGRISKYDANHDGTLDESEQAALKAAIEKGELDLSHGNYDQKETEDKH